MSRQLALDKKNTSRVLKFLTILMAIFFNQSKVVFGLNVSVSDMICLMALAILVFRCDFAIPLYPLVFFLIVSSVTLFSSVLYVPNRFSFYPDLSKVILGYAKLIFLFLYFIVGYRVAALDLADVAAKWYSATAVVISAVGVICIFGNLTMILGMLSFGGYRLRGFMNDPNYFSIVLVSSLAHFCRLGSKFIKAIVYPAVLLGVLATGSKTGITVLICFIVWHLLEKLHLRYRRRTLLANLTIILFGVVILFFGTVYASSRIHYLSSILPASKRVIHAFGSFQAALSGDGSNRMMVWSTAIEVIKMSPLLGIGIGTYLEIVGRFFGIRLISHNTYLQLLAEWGVILAMILFAFLLYVVVKASLVKVKPGTLVIRDIIVVFLVGSLAVSLSNARMFWFFFGALVCNLTYSSSRRSSGAVV